MFRKNNSRQNNRNSARKPNPQGHGESGGQPKSVSPNYRVDLMAHTFTQQTGGGASSYGPRQGKPGFGNQPRPPQHQQPRPPQHQQPRPPQHQQPRSPQHQQPRPPQHQQPRPPQHQQPRPPQHPPLAKMGHTNITVEVPDGLLAAFKEKNAADGKNGIEVINQLINLYNTGRVPL